ITARQIITAESIENAVRLISAIGGSTNAALHIPAIAYEAHLPFDLNMFDKMSRSTPLIAKMNPAASANVIDFYASGGVLAVLSEIKNLLHLEAMTVNGQSLAENIKGHKSPNNEVIKTFEQPFETTGGLGVLYGNISPLGAVTKPAAIDPSLRTFTGPAVCFNSEEEANKAIMGGQIKGGEVLVIRYEGPKGGPGMPEMFKALKLLNGMGLAKKTALVTDGRFSGTNNGCFVGHVSPEAQEGGPIALIENGDIITIDIANQKLELMVTEEILATRHLQWQAPPPRVTSGYLYLYASLAQSAAHGAIIKTRP
ncbi:MAG: dihydroxy-acid dehydratase, partial [Candidatus Adiutrix sp.]